MHFGNKACTLAVAGACALCACGLAGCGSGQHEIIDQGKACSSCHSDQKQTYDVASPAKAASTTGQVNVKTSASEVLICKPTFISSDGARFVPEQVSSAPVSSGQASVQLDAGTWALCTDAGGSVKAQIVVVAPDASGACDVEL